MDMNLRLPSGELEKDETEHKDLVNMLDAENKLHNGDGVSEEMLNADKLHVDDDGGINSLPEDMLEFKEDINLEPLAGMEFESHGEAYSFYQEYARSMGFSTAIQNSRRSKTSREFIDAKFACSRYGTKREYEKPYNNRPRSRQGNKQDPENASGRRSCSKTDCKASMHVKRRPDGKWIIHRFEKEHNHELLPAQAVSEQTRKMYAAMARQFAEYKNVVGLKNDSRSPFDKGRSLTLEVGEANILLEFFMQLQSINSNFFYAIDVSEDQRLKNLFWVDAKSRHDYIHFTDVVSFDTTYVRNKYKMPLALFIGVNHHYQFLLLGCALLSDESTASFSWVMRTWLTAMGGVAPKVIITDKDPSMEAAISEVLPSANHCFALWHILGKVSETLDHVIKQNENFMPKLEKCVLKSWTNEDFEKRWHKMVERFGLKDNEWARSLYEARKQWVPGYMKGIFLAGMSTLQRSESVNCFFDKYVHKKTSVQEFLRHYETIVQDRYEEEAKADSDTWNKYPALRSPSPFEKHSSSLYTAAVFKRFQGEVLGAVALSPKEEKTEGLIKTYRVTEFDTNQGFIVSWNPPKSEISCQCRMFEFKGFLCRHAILILLINGRSEVPLQYILKRWTKDAKTACLIGDGSEHIQYRTQRYNDLCQKAMKLCEEGSLSQESYNAVNNVLKDAFGKCVDVHNSNKSHAEAGTLTVSGYNEEDNQIRSMRTTKKKNPTKKRKVNSEPDVMTVGTQDSLQQLDKLSSRPVALDGYFGPQPNMPGMLNLMVTPSRDNFYGNQQAIQGLGQLNTIAPNHESYYGTQPPMHSLGQMDFFRTPGFSYGIREEPNIRTTQLHDDATRHA